MVSEASNPVQNDLAAIPSNAGEYMGGLGGEIVTTHASVGWSEMTKPGQEVSQDAIYAVNDEQSGTGYYAVFDGAGSSQDGRAAAQSARQTLHTEVRNNFDTNDHNPEDSFSRLFDSMARNVEQNANGGYTTGIVARTEVSNGLQLLRWGSVGDSLGFLVRNGNIVQLNQEETVRQELLDSGESEETADAQGNVITNALGTAEDLYQGLSQTGIIEVQSGDIVLLVSDGITGDRAGQRISGGETLDVLKAVLSKTDITARQKADVLVQIATKNDDRSALVIEIPQTKEHQPVAVTREVGDVAVEASHMLDIPEADRPYALGQKLVMQRNSGIHVTGWEVAGYKLGSNGEIRVRMIGEDLEDGKVVPKQKYVSLSELQETQRAFQAGEITNTHGGRVQIINPHSQ